MHVHVLSLSHSVDTLSVRHATARSAALRPRCSPQITWNYGPSEPQAIFLSVLPATSRAFDAAAADFPTGVRGAHCYPLRGRAGPRRGRSGDQWHSTLSRTLSLYVAKLRLFGVRRLYNHG